MSGDSYITSILNRYAVATGPFSPAVLTASALDPLLRIWAGAQLDSLSLSGSYAKGTAIRGQTDLDLFISLKTDTQETLKEVYESLFARASLLGWQPRRQEVSIGITYNGSLVDLVPGKIQPGYRNYHSLYRKRTSGWTQTNVSLHIDTIVKSGRADEIRVVKIWRRLHGLEFPSFLLELVAIETLKGKAGGALAANVMTVLQFLEGSFVGARFVDPANSANIVSDDLTLLQKALIAGKARESLAKPYWENILW